MNDSSRQSDNASQAGSNTPPRGQTRSNGQSWLSQGLTLAGLVAVGVVGFGLSSGWFDSSNTADNPVVAEPAAATDASVSPFQAELESPQPPPRANVVIPPIGATIPQDGQSIIAEGHRVAQHLLATLPTSIEAKEMLARYEYEFGSTDKAKRSWSEILSVTPNYAYALQGLGDVASIDGNLKEAVQFYRRAVLADPVNLGRQVQLGTSLLQAGEFAESRQVLEAVLAQSPDRIDAHIELAHVLTQMQEYDLALEHFTTALEAAPDRPDMHFGLANVYRRLGNREKSREHQEEHQRLQQTVVETREQGRRDYDDIQALSIDVGNFYVDMARVYLAGGYRPAAERLLLRTSQLDKTNSECRKALAALATGDGKIFDSIRWLNELSQLQPNEFSYVGEISRLFISVQHLDAAEKVQLDFVANNPQHVISRQSLATFYVQAMPNADKAIEFGVQAKDLDPSAENYAMLASIYDSFDKKDLAIDALQTAVSLDPTNASYRQVLALMRDDVPAEAVPDASPKP